MTNPHLTLEGVSYRLPDGRSLFSDLNERFDLETVGLVGRNGAGKSVLARILAGLLPPSSGRCLRSGRVFYLAQQISRRHDATVAALAGAQPVLDALTQIEAGSVDPVHFETVGDRWDIRQRLQSALAQQGLAHLEPERSAASLSGGEAMRVALAGAVLAEADLLILDEPTNHLDQPNRRALLEQLQRWQGGLVVISHDRALLERMSRIVELSALGLRRYGGNYSFYAEQKNVERAASARELELRKLEQKRQEQDLREQRERQEHRQARDSRQGRQANQAKILLGRRRERSELTAGKLKAQHLEAREQLALQVREAASRIEPEASIFLHATTAQASARRHVAELHDVALPFVDGATRAIHLQLGSRQRIGVVGPNGCGKSTLLKLLAGRVQPLAGDCRVHVPVAYLDQHPDYFEPQRSVLDYLQTLAHGTAGMLRMQLAQLGLSADILARPSAQLSGGERLKAVLACALYAESPAQLLLLDEPGNHLDLASVQALESMLRQFRGALLVVSHDEVFLDQLQLTDRLQATPTGWSLQSWEQGDG